ncbi:Uncharacterised protein [Burkholderia pseudomallei]|nr:Uncharacterised protein [Burkholderia pseudomallei]
MRPVSGPSSATPNTPSRNANGTATFASSVPMRVARARTVASSRLPGANAARADSSVIPSAATPRPVSIVTSPLRRLICAWPAAVSPSVTSQSPSRIRSVRSGERLPVSSARISSARATDRFVIEPAVRSLPRSSVNDFKSSVAPSTESFAAPSVTRCAPAEIASGVSSEIDGVPRFDRRVTVPSQRIAPRVSTTPPFAATARLITRPSATPTALASNACFARVPFRCADSVFRLIAPSAMSFASAVNTSAPFAPSRMSARPCAEPIRFEPNTTPVAV